MSSSFVSQVATLPKDIKRNIMRFLSLPTADIITAESKRILQQFLSLNPEERKKYYGVPSISACLKFKYNYREGEGIAYYDYVSCYTTTDIYDDYHILSKKILKNYGFRLDIDNTKYKKQMLTKYLDANQVAYKPNSQVRTLNKLIMNIPNSESKYTTKKSKTIKKKIKLIIVPEPEPVIRIKVPKKKLRIVGDAK